MRKKAEYRSAIRSRRLIRQALMELLQEKEFGKITVTDIVNRADINRGTFYAHYRDMLDVVEQIENEIIQNMLDSLKNFHYQDFWKNPQPVLEEISAFLESDMDFYRILVRSGDFGGFMIRLRNIFAGYIMENSDVPEPVKKSPQFIIRIQFLSGGTMNLYHAWLRGELDCSLKELTAEVSQLITGAVSKLTPSSSEATV